MPKTRLNSPIKSFLLLALALFGCLLMLLVRILVTGSLNHVFLAWNLFLGLIPLVLAFLALLFIRKGSRPVGIAVLVSLSFAWLIFFPNSSYIFTDFIHLIQKGLPDDNPNARGLSNMLVWYDVITRSLFAFVGHFIGLASLYLMHSLWRNSFGRLWGWALVGFSCLAAGYGVFVGRFLRLNSWHLFTHPEAAWSTIAGNLETLDAWVFSIGFAIFLAISYFFVYVFKKHLFTPKETN